MYIKNYHQAVDAIQPYLVDYLKEKGILEEADKKFTCLNPSHPDENPSMSIVTPEARVAHCFSCGFAVNIFQACHLIEGKPMSGPSFIHDTLKHFAVKYGVPLETEGHITEEELYELDTYKAYRTAAELILSGQPTAAFSKAISERGWTPEICREFGVGCIPNHLSFLAHLESLGFDKKFLKDVDLDRADIFGDNRLLFTVRDEHGVPVGFSSRNLKYKEGRDNGAKYVNQRTTGIRINIYKKSSRLYGFDRVLRVAKKKRTPLYIFEGYSDVVTAVRHGLNNCVAIGGAHLTVDQLQLLKEYGYYNLILCLDGDTVGREKVAYNLDNILSGHKDLKVQIVVVPDNKDPDQFIREETISKFKTLAKWDAFQWRLMQFSDDAESDEVCKSMIPLVVNETSFITQDKMCEQLAKNTGTPLSTIRNELNRLQNRKEAEKLRERDSIIEYMVKACQRDPTSAEHAIHAAENKLYEIARRFDEDAFSEDTCFSAVQSLKDAEEAKDGSFSGFRLGEDLKALEDALCGEWRKDVWFCIGGKPNCGKTSLLCKLIYAIAMHETNDACVIYHTIDDTVQQVLPKFVCVAEGSRRLTLNQVIDPNYHKKSLDTKQADRMLSKRENGYEKIKALVKAGRIIIKDANDGNTLAYADRLVRYYRQKFPKRKIVYVLDNFHKLQDFASKDERVRFKDLSKSMKGLTTKYHILGVSTVEYRKTYQNAKAGNQDIAETIQIEYDGNLVAHVHNEMHEKAGQAVHVHRDNTVTGEEVRLPRIEFEISKNKVTDFKESIWLDFWPSSSDFNCVSSEKVAIDARGEKKELDEDMSGQKAEYFEIVQEAIDKNWRKQAPNARYKELFGDWPSNEWQNLSKPMLVNNPD